LSVCDDRYGIQAAFDAEASTFWDDSLVGLPESATEYLREAWARLLSSVPVLVMQGHRGVPAPEAIEALREALGA
jgi:hypothetical protein